MTYLEWARSICHLLGTRETLKPLADFDASDGTIFVLPLSLLSHCLVQVHGAELASRDVVPPLPETRIAWAVKVVDGAFLEHSPD